MVCHTCSPILHLRILLVRWRGEVVWPVSLADGLSVSAFSIIHRPLTFFCPQCSPDYPVGSTTLMQRLTHLHSLGLSEDHSEARDGPVPGGRWCPRNQPRFISFPFITWLLVESLVGNFPGYHPVSIAQGGQLHFLIGNFISALDLKCNRRECLKVSSKKLGYGESFVIYIISPNIWQYQ